MASPDLMVVPSSWQVGRFPFGRPAALMGVLNATPDSFSDGGRHLDPVTAVASARVMQEAGAAWIDLGGESSRPGARPVPTEIELRRVLTVLSALRRSGIDLPLSIDTCKPVVARAALDAGADAINDITGGSDPELLALAAERDCPLFLMHMRGEPGSMQDAPSYGSVVDEVEAFLETRLRRAEAAGVDASRVVLDPGIGFGKRPEHNAALLRGLPRLGRNLGRPLLVGVSRKSLIPALSGQNLPPGERDPASHVLHALLAPHCALLRVHDLPGAASALRLAAAVRCEEA